MTPRNLFNIILKIFGLFFLRDIVFVIPQLISAIPFFTNPFDEGQSGDDGLVLSLLALVILAFYVFIIYQLLFKTDRLIDKLKLDQGFNQEEFSFNISRQMVLTIALIVTASIILTNEIPNFCRQIFLYFEEKEWTHGMTKPDASYSIISAVKIVIGLLLIGERKRIVEFVDKRQSKNQSGK